MNKENLLDKLNAYLKKYMKPQSIQMTIAVSFTIVSVACMGFLGVMMYNRFVNRMEVMKAESTEQLLNQTAINLESYLRNMRRISDAMYYSAIKDKDLATESVDPEMTLLYEANKDNLISIACYSGDGELVAAAPVSTEKEGLNAADQDWFMAATEQMENLHFSTPHVQNLFDNASYRYYWVVSLSRAVELTENGNSSMGVLLVDMNYSSIEQLFKKVNYDTSSEYVYLMDSNGEIIYHPRQKLIYTDLYQENNLEEAKLADGSYEEMFQGSKRLITVKTVSYTGWKIVSIVPMSSFDMGLLGTRMFVIMLMSLTMLAVILFNQLVSAQIARPLQKLNNSIKDWESGNMNPDIYVGGSQETEHLGRTLRSVVAQLRQLMDDIVVEQEEKRKSELDALQSQINPHFLYNTLDSIVWMIEGERYDDAVFMITQLASLFRVSLSRGRTIISIEDEIRHAQNYMNIQKIRYKNKFTVTFKVEEEVLQCCTVKLVVQPLLENAIYYGTEEMDGDGEVTVRGYRNEQDVYLEVSDNGLGMPEEIVEQLLTENNRVRKRGSGVGLLNVHNRIALRFGKPYGLEIESYPDEGTIVRIHLPMIPYTQENQEALEKGTWKSEKEAAHE
ncbi:MAG: sensor histidine kinase [Lachnospiraceae bacterium]|nr:sensor histidine kinase [Lachnospiraceae bacterium]